MKDKAKKKPHRSPKERKALSEGKLSQRERVTLKDVARRLGVSHVTVSMALHNHPRISEARRKEVTKMARMMGYRPDPMLSALAQYRRRKTARVISGELALLNDWARAEELWQFKEYAAYLQAATKEAENLGYHLQEYRIRAERLAPQRLQNIFRARNICGILIPPHQAPFQMDGFDWGRFSVIKIGHSVVRPRAHIVTGDQFRAGVIAVEALRGLGFLRIGYVSSLLFERVTGKNFLGGYLSAAEAMLLKPLILKEAHDVGNLKESPRNIFQRWFDRHKPDVIISALPPSWQIQGLYRDVAVPVAGLSVLESASGFGIDQQPGEIGRVAVRQLCGLIELRESGEPSIAQRILVEPLWVNDANTRRSLRRVFKCVT